MNFTKIIMTGLALTMAIAGANAQTITSRKPHSEAHKNLLANQARSNDKIKLIEQDSFIDLLDEEEPEPDIYTEGWNSKSVNPFKESDVPYKAVIDVTDFVMPHMGSVTSNYGYRAKFRRQHKGIDIGIRSNDTIRAAFDGKVRLTNYEPRGYGNYIILRHPNDLETVYGHLNKILVKPDQVVKAGDPIGLGGSTGRSTGPHLHFETRYMGYAINPSAIVDFTNKTTHTDTYTFTKDTYTQARNYGPARAEQPAKQSTEKRYKSSPEKVSTYTVKRGDSLGKIATRYGVSVSRLRSLNGIKGNNIRPGQKLKLK